MGNKVFKISFLLIFLSVTFSQVFADDIGRDIAEKYLKSYEKVDHYWKGNQPYISKETRFYSDNTDNNSYVEYKVSCKDEKDCGYIMVNIDKGDVKVPISSSSGRTISERMGGDSENVKNYFFGIFEQFSENTKTGEIRFTNPENNSLIKEDKFSRSISDKDDSQLRKKFQELKDISQEYKDSEEFQISKNKRDTEDFLEKVSTRSSIEDDNLSGFDTYYKTKFVDGTWGGKECPGKIPCYKQDWSFHKDPSAPFGRYVCNNGCGPNAVLMLLGYYVNKGYNLIDNIEPYKAPWKNTKEIEKFQKYLSNFFGVKCTKYGGGMTLENLKRIKGYITSKGYKYNEGGFFTNDNMEEGDFIKLWNRIKTDINNNHPIIIRVLTKKRKGREYEYKDIGHLVVAYGYSTLENEGNRITLNFGWGKETSNENVDIRSGTQFYDFSEKANIHYRPVGYFSFSITK